MFLFFINIEPTKLENFQWAYNFRYNAFYNNKMGTSSKLTALAPKHQFWGTSTLPPTHAHAQKKRVLAKLVTNKLGLPNLKVICGRKMQPTQILNHQPFCCHSSCVNKVSKN